MPTRPSAPLALRRRSRLTAAVLLALIAVCAGAVFTAPAAHAASPGAGFGSWAPMSTYGWHGSMIIGGVHTYCILPGAPAPTGPSTDHGVSGTAAGLSAQQLTGINLIVTKYGQTDDPVQAAAVGWAVKALANWDETLHHFGYRGDSLAGAVHWTFSALAPAHSAEIQRRAVLYYDEGHAARAGVSSASGTMTFTTDAADPLRGSVRVDASTSAASGTLALSGATFADTGTATLAGAIPGVDYAIVAAPPSAGHPFAVSGTGSFVITGVAAVRHFTTEGGQDTAGPAGEVGFDVAGADAAPRVPRFAPTITTQVGSAYSAGGAFVDDVLLGGSLADWPRGEDDRLLPVTATAEVYRTDDQPVAGAGVPEQAVRVGSLGLTTDSASGAGPYRVTSVWEMTEPGFYTAIWSIRADDQADEVAIALAPDYSWTEPFAEPSQITLFADVSSLAEAAVTVGSTMSDKIIVRGPIPADGLVVTSSVYRAAIGADPAASCTEEAHVWTSEPHTMLAPGEHVVTAPAVADAGTYYWQERVVDLTGALVHLGACGVAHETTIVHAPTPATPVPEADAPSALAATGAPAVRATAGSGIIALTAGGVLLCLARRRQHSAGGTSA